jgi:hypothetical protein
LTSGSKWNEQVIPAPAPNQAAPPIRGGSNGVNAHPTNKD